MRDFLAKPHVVQFLLSKVLGAGAGDGYGDTVETENLLEAVLLVQCLGLLLGKLVLDPGQCSAV